MGKLRLLLRLWVWFSLRHMLAHRWRALTVLLGVALGAAVFTCVRLAVDASLQSFSRSMDSITGRTEWTLARPGGRVPEEIIASLLREPSVKAASPVLMSYVQPDGPDAEPFLLIGFDPLLDSALRQWTAETAGSESSAASRLELLTEPFTLLAGRPLAQSLGLQTGSGFTVKHVNAVKPFRVVGILETEGMALAEGGRVALCDISTFQELTGAHGFVDRIDIAFRGMLGERAAPPLMGLPEGVVLERPGESRSSGANLIRSYQLNLSILSFVSLFVGMFLVYSLVTLNATARRHEIAILRSLGASARSILALFLAEGAFFGVMGWLLAIPLGSLIIQRLLDSIRSTITLLFVRVPPEDLTLAPEELLLSFLVTLSVSLVASSKPAIEAMRVPPRESMIMFATESSGGMRVWLPAFLAILMILAVWPLSLVRPVRGIPLFGYLATFLLFLGFSFFSPGVLKGIGTLFPGFLRKIGGMPAFLGGRYVKDAGKRAAVSVGALITAVALFVALNIMIHSFRTTVETWVTQSISGNLFIEPHMASLNQYKDPVPKELVDFLRSHPSRLDLLPYRRIVLRHDQKAYQLEAIDFEMFLKHASFLMLEGSAGEILPQLARGEGLLVSEVFANQMRIRTGSRFRLAVHGIELDLPVLGVFRDYRTHGGVVHFSLPAFEALTGDGAWSGARIVMNAEDPFQEQARQLRRSVLLFCAERGLEVGATLGGELREEILKVFDETFAVTGVLLVVALVVATLGITSTLTVLVLERAHQLHTLMAVGASTGQVRAMILWESVLMVAAGESLGTACGFVLSLLLIYVINRQSFGWTFIYGVDWTGIVASLPLILATAFLATIPATRLVFSRSSAAVLREK
ncbi:MAG: ABC transporter permease [Syntrophobacteraceae bacterium]|jgi:putative ABC transport system permease protein|nr:ABC transporter permease [Syntrophobacteraceae bacterium]